MEGKLPEKYNEDSVRPALLTHFHLGRLASKLVVRRLHLHLHLHLH